MRADPEPDQPIGSLDSDCTVVQSNAGWPVAADSLEMERWVRGIRLQETKGLVGKVLDGRRQTAITCPEVWRGMVGDS